MDHEKRVREFAWEAIMRGGEQLRQSDPGLQLTPAQARQKFTKETDQGKKLLDLYNNADSQLTVSEYRAKADSKAALATLGANSWDQLVSKLAKEVAAAKGLDHQQGLAFIRKHCPSIMKAYQQERPLGGR